MRETRRSAVVSGRSLIGQTAALALAALAASLILVQGCTPLSFDPPAPDGTGHQSVVHRGSGVRHEVQRGETVWRIGKTYGVSVMEIVEANRLGDDYAIRVGQELLIPGATEVKRVPVIKKPGVTSGVGQTTSTGSTQPSSSGSGKMAWPLAGRGRGSVNSGFGNRTDPVSNRQTFHQGIDMRAPLEERVLAAGRGEVVFSGRQSGYGNVVMLDHGKRLITLYAHLSRSIVKLEQVVEQGQIVGYVGSSGKATGCHLHFEVRYKGVPVDPLKYLP